MHECPGDRCLVCFLKDLKELLMSTGMADTLKCLADAAVELSEESDIDATLPSMVVIDKPVTAHDTMLTLAMTAGRLDAIVQNLQEGK